MPRCGLKSRTDLWSHLKRHSLSFAAYHKQFPKAPTIPSAGKAVKNMAQLMRGRKMRKDLKDLRAKGAYAKTIMELKKMTPTWKAIVPILLAHPDWNSKRVLEAAATTMPGISISEGTMLRMRKFAGIARKKGRPRKSL